MFSGTLLFMFQDALDFLVFSLPVACVYYIALVIIYANIDFWVGNGVYDFLESHICSSSITNLTSKLILLCIDFGFY